MRWSRFSKEQIVGSSAAGDKFDDRRGVSGHPADQDRFKNNQSGAHFRHDNRRLTRNALCRTTNTRKEGVKTSQSIAIVQEIKRGRIFR